MASFPFIFGLFKQTSLQYLQQIYVKKCPSSIWCQDSNPQPLERESLPITTIPSSGHVCLKRPIINKKEAGIGPFFKKTLYPGLLVFS